MATPIVVPTPESDNNSDDIQIGAETWRLYEQPSREWPWRMRNLASGVDLGFRSFDERENHISLGQMTAKLPKLASAAVVARMVGLSLTPNVTEAK